MCCGDDAHFTVKITKYDEKIIIMVLHYVYTVYVAFISPRVNRKSRVLVWITCTRSVLLFQGWVHCSIAAKHKFVLFNILVACLTSVDYVYFLFFCTCALCSASR